ncbi:MAG: hypothetical protein CVU08_11210 [Bacteroidetes bacterium HGW-Bacteroidetes-3]|nr:MAG: hypothetical protein CVU08_11210 [Bacteroidetes bacterium HGW-Bacteroidetes-3]
MRRKNLTYLCCLLMMLLSFSVFAKKKEPPEPPQNLPPSGPGLPINGGISLLIIAGAAYGVYAKIKRLKN